jgi:hypothetical protein
MECPNEWKNHVGFHPKALTIFFLGTEFESYLNSLEAFCCPEHRIVFKKSLALSRKLQKKREPEYFI